MGKKYSIIIPVYNVENTLKRCLESVINQTYKNLEIICVNDGSKDKSLEILREYEKKDNRIIVIDKKNGGLASARNSGLEIFSGDIVTFIDSDDWYELDCIESINKIFEENQNLDLCRSNYFLTDGENEKTNNEQQIYDGELELNIQYKKEILNNMYKGKIQSFSWLLFINKDIIKKEKIFFNNKVTFMEDIEFFTRLIFKIKNIYFSNKPKLYYYYNINGLTKSHKNLAKKSISINELRNNIVKTLLENNEKNLSKVANSIYFKFIVEMIFELYITEKNKNNIQEILELIFKEEKFNNFDMKELNIYYKLFLYSLKNKKYKWNIYLFNIKKFLKGIK